MTAKGLWDGKKTHQGQTLTRLTRHRMRFHGHPKMRRNGPPETRWPISKLTAGEAMVFRTAFAAVVQMSALSSATHAQCYATALYSLGLQCDHPAPFHRDATGHKLVTICEACGAQRPPGTGLWVERQL